MTKGVGAEGDDDGGVTAVGGEGMLTGGDVGGAGI